MQAREEEQGGLGLAERRESRRGIVNPRKGLVGPQVEKVGDHRSGRAGEPLGGLSELAIGGAVNARGVVKHLGSAGETEVEQLFQTALVHAPVVEHATARHYIGLAQPAGDPGHLRVVRRPYPVQMHDIGF